MSRILASKACNQARLSNMIIRLTATILCVTYTGKLFDGLHKPSHVCIQPLSHVCRPIVEDGYRSRRTQRYVHDAATLTHVEVEKLVIILHPGTTVGWGGWHVEPGSDCASLNIWGEYSLEAW